MSKIPEKFQDCLNEGDLISEIDEAFRVKTRALDVRTKMLESALSDAGGISRDTFKRWRIALNSWKLEEDKVTPRMNMQQHEGSFPPRIVDPVPSKETTTNQIALDVSRARKFDGQGIHQGLCEILAQLPFQESGDDGNGLYRLGLQYIQGLHDIGTVALSVGKKCGETDLAIVHLITNIITQRLFAYHSSLKMSVSVNQTIAQVKQILLSTSYLTLPDNDDNPCDLYYMISWMITFFSHDVADLSTAVAVWNILIATPPPFLIYFLAATVVVPHFAVDMCFLQACVFLRSCPPLQLALRSRSPIEIDYSGVCWYDANETFATPLPPCSLLPPFWSPVLLDHTLCKEIKPAHRLIDLHYLKPWAVMPRDAPRTPMHRTRSKRKFSRFWPFHKTVVIASVKKWKSKLD